MPTKQEQGIYVHGEVVTQHPVHGGLVPLHGGTAGPIHGMNGGGGVVVPEAETTALLARMSVQPDATRQDRINTLILALKTAGVWAKLDALYVFASHDQNDALLNWKEANAASLVNAPSFTVDRGFTGNGTTNYINTGLNPAGLANFQQDSANIAAWCRNEVNAGPLAGLLAGTNLHLFPRNAGLQNARMNSGTSRTFAQASSIGLSESNRSAAAAWQLRRNGVQISAQVDPSTAESASNITALHNNAVFGAEEIAMLSFGASLSDAESLARYNAINTYLTAIGAA